MPHFIALDFETTGLNPSIDSIIEYAFIKFDAETFEEIAVLSGYINPGIPISETITELTGIRDEDVFLAPKIDEIIQDIEDFVAGHTLVGHNVNFDISFLCAAGVSVANNASIDTFMLANFLSFGVGSLSLSSLCEFYNIPLISAHRALDDTRATLQLLSVLISEMQHQAKNYPEIYEYMYARADTPGDYLLYSIYLKNITRTDLHISDISSLKAEHKKNLNPQKYMYFSVPTDMTNTQKDSYEYISKFPNFEPRESQEIMCDIVDKHYGETSHIALEAPTGTGKTFGYLIPSILHAKQSGEQVCIATSTKILQDQICDKDIAYLKQELSVSFTYAKIMGRRNYFSLQGYYEYLGIHKSLQREQISFFLKIYFWSLGTLQGELKELEYYGNEYSFLGYIHGEESKDYEGENISGEFYLQAKKKLEQSDIIITNTHVLLQDIIADNTLFGSIESYVIDEAHALEDVVTSSQQKVFSLKLLRQIIGVYQRKIQIYALDLNLDKQSTQIEYSASELLDECAKIASSHSYYNSNYKKYLFKNPDIHSHPFFGIISGNIISLISDVIKQLDTPDYRKYFYRDIIKLEQIKDFFQHFFIQANFEKYIYVCDVSAVGEISLAYTILHSGEFLQNELWSKKNRILLVSATLFHPGRDSYTDILLGTKNFHKYILPSVFDYKNQAQIYIPTSLSDSKNIGEKTLSFLGEFFMRVGGRTLMLCTSYSSIKAIYLGLHSKLLKQDIMMIAQGFAGGRNKHLQSFLKSPENSILLGTDSFWQGVDIPGENLKYLVIHKLPFTPPSDPIFLARSQLFYNSFYDYAIPKTCIKLRQGLGRLIRSKNDTGLILFLDDRVVTQKWGQEFLRVFPEDISITKDTPESLILSL